MDQRAMFAGLCLAAAGSAIVGGIFYAFSSFVMPALGRLPPVQGVEAMRSINVAVIRPSFMGVFVGTALACLVVGAGALFGGQRLVLAGTLLYLVGAFGLTMLLHQPLNLRLAMLPPAQALAFWPRYLRRWRAWNHLRAAAALLALALFVAALVQAARFDQ